MYTGSMRIYFSGLGGVGIGPLAEIAHDAGYDVVGSDLVEGLTTRELEERGFKLKIYNQDGSYLREQHQLAPIDWFIYTAALDSPDAPGRQELLAAQELGIHTAKRDELIAKIIEEKNLKLIAVSGTHGKTTTTGMLVWVFQQLGIPVSYSVGTTLSFAAEGKFDPASKYFVYEADEYDRNMLRFRPALALLPSVDWDHPDIYPSPTHYHQAFGQFIEQSELTILWRKTAEEIKAPLGRAWALGDDELLPLRINGDQNRHNATLVVKAFEYLQLGDRASVVAALEEFPGTDRRFEQLADNLYTDYGHHPVEIAATLEQAREVSDHVVLVYQPHQNRRQQDIKDEYRNQFERAETIYWVPTYLVRGDTEPVLTPEELYANVTNPSAFHSAKLDDELWNTIQRARTEGKLVLMMGAGTIDGWVRDHLAETTAN